MKGELVSAYPKITPRFRLVDKDKDKVPDFVTQKLGHDVIRIKEMVYVWGVY